MSNRRIAEFVSDEVISKKVPRPNRQVNCGECHGSRPKGEMMGVKVMTINDFRVLLEDVLDQSGLVIVPETTAEDVEGWDSLTHARLLVRIEQRYRIDLPIDDVGKAKNVGELLTIVNRTLLQQNSG
jgi:acyl carrier protein